LSPQATSSLETEWPIFTTLEFAQNHCGYNIKFRHDGIKELQMAKNMKTTKNQLHDTKISRLTVLYQTCMPAPFCFQKKPHLPTQLHY